MPLLGRCKLTSQQGRLLQGHPATEAARSEGCLLQGVLGENGGPTDPALH